MSWDSLLQLELAGYLREPDTLIAVLLPACAALLCLVLRAPGACLRLQLQAFVLGTASSVLCSFWVEVDGVLSLHMLPGYALVLVLAPAEYRPGPPRAFAFTFFSMLMADVICAAQYPLLSTGSIPAWFYHGVGGAGFGDALFCVPPCVAAYAWASSRLERHAFARVSLVALVRGQIPPAEAPQASESARKPAPRRR